MGLITAKRFSTFKSKATFPIIFGIVIPLINGCLVAWVSGFFLQSVGNRLIFSILGASASYIAVPAAMRLAAPKADPGLYILMALGITFPFNISIGMPIYYLLIQHFH